MNTIFHVSNFDWKWPGHAKRFAFCTFLKESTRFWIEKKCRMAVPVCIRRCHILEEHIRSDDRTTCYLWITYLSMAQFTCSYWTDHSLNVSLIILVCFSFEFNETWWSFRTHKYLQLHQFSLNSNVFPYCFFRCRLYYQCFFWMPPCQFKSEIVCFSLRLVVVKLTSLNQL